jgi:hypothetical protein
MPSFRNFPKLDVFAFIDSDSPEAKQFTTYMVYWECFARLVTSTYGQTPRRYRKGIVDDLESRKKYRSLTASRFAGDEILLRQLLLNAWNSELGLYLVDDGDPRLTAQNQWNNVYAYYATGRTALAWLLVRDSAAPKRHRPLLRAMAQQVTGSNLFPTPWNLVCHRCSPLTYGGFGTPPNEVSNLSLAADPFDMAAKALKTTRKKRIEELRAEELEKLKLRRAPSGLLLRLDNRTEPTTVFDFIWRTRTRSNYGDPSMFYVGTLDQTRSEQYLTAIRTVTDATMLVLEALIAQKAPEVLRDAAVHYISRDRSKVTDKVVGSRLQEIGLLQ